MDEDRAYIGPLPEIVNAPLAPVPWEADGPEVYDALGRTVLTVNTHSGSQEDDYAIAVMIANAITAKYEKPTPEPRMGVNYLVDDDHDYIFEVAPDEWTYGDVRTHASDVAASYAVAKNRNPESGNDSDRSYSRRELWGIFGVPLGQQPKIYHP